VRVTPRAGTDAIDGVDDAGRLRVRVRAAPADGAANAAALRTVAGALELAPSRVELVSGATNRVKRMAVRDVDGAALIVRWPGLLTRTD